ncbi:Myosin heavy chain-related isoform 4 [Hibiscus syriacus]|uniref:Myosin heavy chain-related isoform 4 n=1 Tax=Hibiscus syriacus TaxID=106335 RepID=A0A6A2YQ47_HIBSY|nr:Myosin heavy chain-related isoform 4 [Hibiscus syriacus]
MRLRPSDSNVTEDQEPFMGNQGDKQVLFVDEVLKFTSSGKMKRRILMITDFAIDIDSCSLKRRIALAAVDKMCLSELSDNFFAIIIPTEYDLLMASTRKTLIVTVLVDATKSASEYELEVFFSDRFEYNASSDDVKVQFEGAEGGVRTKIVKT